MNVNLDLEGKVVIVTGAAGGIGFSISQFLTSFGMKVVRSDIKEGTQKLENSIFVPADISKVSDVDYLFEQAQAHYGSLFGVVNCAAIIRRIKDLNEIDSDVLEQEFRINQAGSFYVARKALNILSKNDPSVGGRIVLLSSQGAFTGGYVGSTTYAMTKASLSALLKSLTRFGAPNNITVNSISPGAIETPMLRIGSSDEDLENFKKMIPLGRFGEPEDIAGACVFLLSSLSRYVTGTTMHVNGGQYLP